MHISAKKEFKIKLVKPSLASSSVSDISNTQQCLFFNGQRPKKNLLQYLPLTKINK